MSPPFGALGSNVTPVTLNPRYLALPSARSHCGAKTAVRFGKRRRGVAPPCGMTVPVNSQPQVVPPVPEPKTSVQKSAHKNQAAIPSKPLEILSANPLGFQLSETPLKDEQQKRVLKPCRRRRLGVLVDHLMGFNSQKSLLELVLCASL